MKGGRTGKGPSKVVKRRGKPDGRKWDDQVPENREKGSRRGEGMVGVQVRTIE